jgi:hypothetical protein
MNFETFGPFELNEWSTAGFTSLFARADEESAGLGNAIGVYLFAVLGRKGLLTPWYVGKTVQRFRTRVPQHLEHLKELSSMRSSKVVVFLIARVTAKTGGFKKPSRKVTAPKDGAKSERRSLKSIDHLEFALIGSCLIRNAELKNQQEKSFHKSLVVPGYVNDKGVKRTASANKLHKMLSGKRSV